MKRDELKELMVGAIASVPTPFDDAYRVDYERMAAATEHWIQAGLVKGKSVLKPTAAMGEGPQLTEQEWGRLLETVVKAANGRVPVMGAIHYKDTTRTIEDAKRAADLGVIGLQISPPIFNQPTQGDLLRYYGAVSAAIDIGIMVYNTYWLPYGTVCPDTFRKMVDFEHVIAIKWSAPKNVAYEAIYDLADAFNIVDNATDPVLGHKLGARGFLSDGISAYPSYYLELWELLDHGRYEAARVHWERMIIPFRKFYAGVGEKSGSDAKIEKAMCQIMGLPLGPPRPPSIPLDDAEMTELKGLMMSWNWPVPQSAHAS